MDGFNDLADGAPATQETKTNLIKELNFRAFSEKSWLACDAAMRIAFVAVSESMDEKEPCDTAGA